MIRIKFSIRIMRPRLSAGRALVCAPVYVSVVLQTTGVLE